MDTEATEPGSPCRQSYRVRLLHNMDRGGRTSLKSGDAKHGARSVNARTTRVLSYVVVQKRKLGE